LRAPASDKLAAHLRRPVGLTDPDVRDPLLPPVEPHARAERHDEEVGPAFDHVALRPRLLRSLSVPGVKETL